MIGKSLLKYGVCAAVAAGVACVEAQATFVGFVTVKTTVTVPAAQTWFGVTTTVDVYTLYARFNGASDTALNAYNLSLVAGTVGAEVDPYGQFYHKDNDSYNSNLLTKSWGSWSPTMTISVNRPLDSYLMIGGVASATNTTNADPSWHSGGSGAHAGSSSLDWSRPDLVNNGTIGWFNGSPPNNQGRVGLTGNTATDVRLGQFVIDSGTNGGKWRLTIAYNDGIAGSAVQFATGTFHLGCPWYRDIDGDGLGAESDGVLFSCAGQPAGYVGLPFDNCPSVYNPDQADCDANAVGNACEIASGFAPDCDGDSIPDQCEGAVIMSPQTTLLPISGATAAEFSFTGLPRAYGRPPKLTIEATADLGAANDGILLTVDGASAGTFFVADGTDCPATPNVATISYTLANFNAIVADGVLTVRATAFGAVNSSACGASGGIRFKLLYDVLPTASDCNSNGQLDSCEIGTGAVPDCNANGKPDSCDFASGYSVDCNGNGRPDSCDIALGSSTDLNGNAVPDDCEFIVGGSGYATIQAAIAAAAPGTVIRVGPGVHTAPTVIDSKPVTLVSLGGAAVTTLSGQGAQTSIMAVRSAAANGTVVDGFTFRDGTIGAAAYGVRVGGAMFLENTTATIRNCRFIGNASQYGGGVYGLGFSGTIEDCRFEGNSAQFYAGGVQLGFGGTSVFRRNTVIGNSAPRGGGMHIVNWFEGPLTAVALDDCDFIDNTASVEGGALLWYGNLGTNLTVSHCRVVGNSAPDAAFTRVSGPLSFAITASRFCRNVPADVAGSVVDGGGNIFSVDCNANGICDADELAAGTQADCNANGLLDSCELVAGTAFDCNENGVLDACDIAAGTSHDVDSNGVPDDCKPDCDGDGLPDAWEIATGLARDCDSDGLPDNCEIASDHGADKNANGRLDACELAWGDLNLDGIVNGADLSVLLAFWGVPQAPVGDINGDGIVAGADLGLLLGHWGVVPW